MGTLHLLLCLLIAMPQEILAGILGTNVTIAAPSKTTPTLAQTMHVVEVMHCNHFKSSAHRLQNTFLRCQKNSTVLCSYHAPVLLHSPKLLKNILWTIYQMIIR